MAMAPQAVEAVEATVERPLPAAVVLGTLEGGRLVLSHRPINAPFAYKGRLVCWFCPSNEKQENGVQSVLVNAHESKTKRRTASRFQLVGKCPKPSFRSVWVSVAPHCKRVSHSKRKSGKKESSTTWVADAMGAIFGQMGKAFGLR